MKLPEDRADKIKVLALIAVGAAAVIYAVIQLGLTPLLRSQRARRERIRELEESLRIAGAEIKSADGAGRDTTDVLAAIMAFSNSHVLHPRLGNYLLGATEALEAHAARAGLPLGSIREIGRADVPKPANRAGGNLLKYYAVRTGVVCGYFDFTRLLQAIEEANPYLCVANFTVASQSTPDKHAITFDVQFPVWADPEMPAALQADIDAAKPDVDETPPGTADADLTEEPT